MMKYICSLLVVSNFEVSREFYEKMLNLKVTHDHGENIVFENGFALHSSEHFTALIDQRKVRFGENNIELYFESDELDKIEKRLKKNGISFVHTIRMQPWKQRVIRFYDPDRYIVEIGEPME